MGAAVDGHAVLDPRVVDQHIDSAESAQRRIDQRLSIIRGADIGGHGKHQAASLNAFGLEAARDVEAQAS